MGGGQGGWGWTGGIGCLRAEMVGQAMGGRARAGPRVIKCGEEDWVW